MDSLVIAISCMLGFGCGIWALISFAEARDKFFRSQAALGKDWAIDKIVSNNLRFEREAVERAAELERESSERELAAAENKEIAARVRARVRARLEELRPEE
jgi:hypothetical protein